MLETLLYPNTVAVIGASRSPDKVGGAIMKNLIEGGFRGTLVPVNPSATEVFGVKAYKSLADFGGQIDLSVVVVGVKDVKAAVESSIAAGAKTIIVITAGFKEIGPEGAAAERELVDLCRSSGVRL